MIKESVYYDIICDRCGKSFNDESNTCCYPDIESVKMTAIRSEWRAIGGKHYCPNCYEMDEETYKYKPKKAYKNETDNRN